MTDQRLPEGHFLGLRLGPQRYGYLPVYRGYPKNGNETMTNEHSGGGNGGVLPPPHYCTACGTTHHLDSDPGPENTPPLPTIAGLWSGTTCPRQIALLLSGAPFWTLDQDQETLTEGDPR